MRRTFVGDSQSTMQLKLDAAAQRDRSRARGPRARGPSGAGSARPPGSTGAPPSQRTRSRSWVREVLDDADVADAVGERADALGGDEEDLAELAVEHAAAQLEQRRVEALDVADGSADAGPRRTTSISSRGLGGRRRPAASRRARATPGGGELARPRAGAPRSARRRSRSRARRGASSSSIVPWSSAGVVDGAEAVAARVDGAGEAHAARAPGGCGRGGGRSSPGRRRRRAAAGYRSSAPRRALGYPPWATPPHPGWSSAPRRRSATASRFGAHVVVHDGVVIGDGRGRAGRRDPRQAADAGASLDRSSR